MSAEGIPVPLRAHAEFSTHRPRSLGSRARYFMTEKFSDFIVDDRIKSNLAAANFVTPTPVQAGAIPAALSGHDVLATAQTGTGKTLAFAVPIVNQLLSVAPGRGVEALILLPTRELAMQVEETFRTVARGLPVNGALVVGGLGEHAQLAAIRRGARYLVATPGRLEDFIKRRLVDLSRVKMLVLDEADRMVDMGFLPQMRTILAVLPKERQNMCFSATLVREVAHLVHQHLHDPVRVEIGSTTRHADSITLQVYEVPREQKIPLLMSLLHIEDGSTLVFARTKRGADRIAHKLKSAGFSAAVIHGNRSQNQRIGALNGFRDGRYRVLVATDIAARGIHITGIAHVINFDLPQVPEDFIHRVGRTGRASETGTATTFVTPADRPEIFRIERLLNLRITRLPLPAGLPSEPVSIRHPASHSPRDYKRSFGGGRKGSRERFGRTASGRHMRQPHRPESFTEANQKPTNLQSISPRQPNTAPSPHTPNRNHPLAALYQEYGDVTRKNRPGGHGRGRYSPRGGGSGRHGRGDGPGRRRYGR